MMTCLVRRFARSALLWSWLLLGLVGAALAQPGGPGTSEATVAPRVSALSGELELGVDIEVGVTGLSAWAASHNANKLVPFLNGRAIRGNYPEEVHASADHVRFELQIMPENRAVWTDLLGEPSELRKPVEFSVGLEGETPFATDFTGDRQPRLTVISPIYGWLSLVVVVVTFVVFMWLARNTGIIRDTGTRAVAGRLAPYNLGRTQMAFWFFLTFTSYIVIWLITGAIDTITPSLLALMGISAGTALSEVLIDANKDATSAGKLQVATAEKQALEQGVAELQTQLTVLTARPVPTVDDATARDSLNRQLLDQRTRLNQAAQQVKALATTSFAGVSRGFLADILSDGGGYSFHRFQIVAWTIGLGGVFLSAVYNTLTMPEFSATMLGLMGMSSGTYIGFKFPEQR